MDWKNYTTETAERKKGQHLQREERGAIQHLKRQGYSNRAIAREIGCSRPLWRMSFGVVHRLAKAVKAGYPATPPNEEKQSTDPTGSVLGDSIALSAALSSFAG